MNYEEQRRVRNEQTQGKFEASVKGREGELELSVMLNSLGDEFHVIDDVMLKTKRGTTQIDHIVVSIYGIFVIETKNYKGYIFGDCYGRVWTQTLYTGQKNTLYSPVLQNLGHMKNLTEQTKIREHLVKSVIVFTSKDVNLSNVRCDFCYTTQGLYNMLTSLRKVVIPPETLIKIIRRIDKININGYENKLKHIEYVNKMRGDRGR